MLHECHSAVSQARSLKMQYVGGKLGLQHGSVAFATVDPGPHDRSSFINTVWGTIRGVAQAVGNRTQSKDISPS